jgi:class 3 adenylate cyclase
LPLYMDRHDGENLTPEAVAEAHVADLKLQDKYDCKFITYWYDDEDNSVFCLISAPDKSTVHKVHSEAHGFPHNEIMEVDRTVVKAFLGRVVDPEPTAGELSIDSPFRAIMFTDIEGSTQVINELGDDKSMELLRTHNSLTRDALRTHAGREIKHTGDGFMASFTSAVKAVECAITIQNSIGKYNKDNLETAMNIRIGISAGEPVHNDNQLYGAAVNLAARLCAQAKPGTILVAQVVRDLLVGKGISFAGSGEFNAKGFDQPIPLIEVTWQDTSTTQQLP